VGVFLNAGIGYQLPRTVEFPKPFENAGTTAYLYKGLASVGIGRQKGMIVESVQCSESAAAHRRF